MASETNERIEESQYFSGYFRRFEKFDGFYSLRFTPVFGTPTGTYELFVLALCLEAMPLLGVV